MATDPTSDDDSDDVSIDGQERGVAVQVRNLSKRFGEVVALDDVSFDIRDGEFFTLLGPSGSGKSTLLRIVAGLEPASSGEVRIDGSDMARVPPEKRPTNMVFQHLALFPHKNVYENLEFGLKMQGVGSAKRRERADEMLGVIELEGAGEKHVDELSGGEQQRIALGRALLANPKILLLDEPLASLDRNLKEEMQLELRRIHEELGSTFLYVTHDQDVALTASDRVAVIDDGTIVQIGTPHELYETPATAFVADFIGDTNLFTGRVVGGDGDRSTIETDAGLRIVVRAEDGESLADGSSVRISLRPEEVEIGERAADPENWFEGTINERVYRGDRTRYEVAVGDTVLLVQRTRRKEDTESLDAGDEVAVGWNASDGYLVEVG